VKPDFWLDQSQAQSVMRQISYDKNIVNTLRNLERRVDDLTEMVNLSIDEKNASLQVEIRYEVGEVTKNLDKLEIQLILNDEYDERDAILAIHAGAGGTESQDWVEILLRMYLRWTEKNNYKVEILDTSPGDIAGIKSVTLEIRGDYSYGYLKSEFGVHRLVRLSPFDADHARHTSFALVEVLPEVKEPTEIDINPDDIRIDAFRSSGPGGQHMQKTSSAVRVTHNPTGITVVCQNQRSQYQNREVAMRILHARLLEIERRKKEAEKSKIKGKRIDVGWGSQIRSYILHPYKMVKDHRTGYESSNPNNVLDGELDNFIINYLRSKVGE
jgi:peptide chain release factor 2